MNEAAIHAQGLGTSPGDEQALRGLDLTVRSGENFGLLGHNGAGKTTTVNPAPDRTRR